MTIIHPQNYKKNSSQQKKLLSGCNPILNSEPMMQNYKNKRKLLWVHVKMDLK